MKVPPASATHADKRMQREWWTRISMCGRTELDCMLLLRINHQFTMFRQLTSIFHVAFIPHFTRLCRVIGPWRIIIILMSDGETRDTVVHRKSNLFDRNRERQSIDLFAQDVRENTHTHTRSGENRDDKCMTTWERASNSLLCNETRAWSFWHRVPPATHRDRAKATHDTLHRYIIYVHLFVNIFGARCNSVLFAKRKQN